MAKTITKPRPYEKWEVDYIKENYRKTSARKVSIYLNRTEASITSKACSLKIPSSRTWIDEDVKYLKINYMLKADDEIAKDLNKSVTSISSKRYSLGLIREKCKSTERIPWSNEDTLRLKELYNKGLGNKEIGNILGRSETSVNTKKYKLGYSKSITEIHWSKEDEELLIELYPDTDKEELIKIFNRTWYSILGHAKVVGVVRSDMNRVEKIWTEEQLLFLKDNWFKMSDCEISEELNKRPYFIKIMREKHGFGKKDDMLQESHVIDICNYEGIEYIRTFVKENENTEVKSIEFECGKHGISSVYWSKFNKFGNSDNHICAKCNLENITKWNNEGILKFLNERNIIFIRFNSENKLINTSIITECATCSVEIPITISSLISNYSPKCNKCNGIENRKITVDFIKDELKDTYLNLISTKYPKYDEDILYTCEKHLHEGIQKSSWANLKKNKRCKYCGIESSAETRRKSHEQFETDLKNISNGRLISLSQYEYSDVPMTIKCIEHNHIWNPTPSNILLNPYCPICTNAMSRNERAIYDFLKDNNIDFKSEYRIDECRNINPLPFDFAIFHKDELYCLWEHQGRQHIQPVNFGGISDEQAEVNFERVKIRDGIKRKYCEDNNIKLVYSYHSEKVEDVLKRELKELL